MADEMNWKDYRKKRTSDTALPSTNTGEQAGTISPAPPQVPQISYSGAGFGSFQPSFGGGTPEEPAAAGTPSPGAGISNWLPFNQGGAAAFDTGEEPAPPVGSSSNLWAEFFDKDKEKPSSLPEPVITPDEPVEVQTDVIGTDWTPPEQAETGPQGFGGDAMQMYMDYAMQEEDPMVTAERQRLDRNNLLRTEQAKRDAHERAVQAGYQPGTPQYEQMMRAAVTDANNQNIMATNNFHDFQRARRAEQQAELMKIYEEGTEAEQKAWDRFEDMVKFLPTLKAQEAALRGHLGGYSLTDVIGNMYNADGTIKDSYKDLTRAELVKQGMTDAVSQMEINPETGEAWKEGEQEAYVEGLYADNFQNLLWSSEEVTEGREEQGAAEGRLEGFLSTGDTAGLQPEDWQYLTPTQIGNAIKDGHIVDYTTTNVPTHQWETKDKMSGAEAVQKMKEAFPNYEPGTVIQKDGELYIIQGWSATSGLDWSLTKGTLERVRLTATPASGGEPIKIYESKLFNP